MATQSEQQLENELIEQLSGLGYTRVAIKDSNALMANLKTQLEKHNDKSFSDSEFAKILNYLKAGSVLDCAMILRDKMHLKRDDGSDTYIEFLNQEHWCQNEYQVTNQVTVEGSYKNRYDVTLLVNGLPLIQIELKRRGLELKEAFNQVNRYHRHSYWAESGLFQYVQVFVISNGVNTKYYANNKRQSFKQTFYWSDVDNNIITQLNKFAALFLEPCHISKMICKYLVISGNALMILRPYQFYAVESIIDRVKHGHSGGYIWHTTGSGKTLTSFKASQILTKLPSVHKLVFVVDRKDLDYQTTKEFNNFSQGSVDGTDNTKTLVKQFTDDTKLIVTTIQKLNTAISKSAYIEKMVKLKDERVVFIFDECHRSQFGETHKRITEFFNNTQMFGFTGTPIFAVNAAKNSLGKRTTKDLFGECLHKYVITDAIKDENVLKFSIEYVGRYKERENSSNNIDIEVEDIDTKELLESPVRLEKIADYIIHNHARKTHSREFTAMFCVSNIDTLIKYYNIFKQKKEAGEHNLKIATIFSYGANEDDRDANGFIPDEIDLDNTNINQHSRDSLEEFISDYNKMFGCKFSTKDSQSFYNYYNDISKQVRAKNIDILLVVNMFLTGFDSKPLNTLYVDKNLKYHGLIQAFSRTNRILNEQKSQGNIICFRNLKNATDDAVALFSNKNAKDEILLEPIEKYIEYFNQKLDQMQAICPTVNSVNDLVSESDELTFVKAFRELMRLKNVLTSFSDFTFEIVGIDEQEYEDYKSKYLDLYEKSKSDGPEKVSILNDVDFELELIQRDDINVAYILQLLAKMQGLDADELEKSKQEIMKVIAGDVGLRSKRELIQKFIDENLPFIDDPDDIPREFDSFIDVEFKNEMNVICELEKLDGQKLSELINDCTYAGRTPRNEEIIELLLVKPKIKERRTVRETVMAKVSGLIAKFIDGIN